MRNETITTIDKYPGGKPVENKPTRQSILGDKDHNHQVIEVLFESIARQIKNLGRREASK